jgi:hypothetical protein
VIGSDPTVRAGRFFSGIGYLNEQHAHTWDFVDTPLAYRAMLGNDLFTGASNLILADFVWKWAPDGNGYDRNFKSVAVSGNRYSGSGTALSRGR